MSNERNELAELFDLFHDFEILHVDFQLPELFFIIKMPWNQIVKECPEEIGLMIFDCLDFNCKYQKLLRERMKQGDSIWDCPVEIIETSDSNVISELILDVQRADYKVPNNHTLVCNGLPNSGGGEIYLTGSQFKIFTKEEEDISLEKMVDWRLKYRNRL